ncbi:MAG: LysM peptidoglycan-binding domain-containing protein [Anaerolineae bacterium]|nr:LysM peptidoglycan-binding domain-containing protein [Anaerolineae bacterium]
MTKRILTTVLLCAVLCLAGAQNVRADVPGSNPIVHVVRWGENLTGIAREYGTTVQVIVQANNLANPNWIYAGQRLLIPGGTTLPPVSGCAYVVQRGDTLTAIAYRHGVSVNGIVRANSLANPNRIYAGQRLQIPCASPGSPTPPAGGTYYTVQRGDTLAKIAVRFGTSVWSIVQLNNITNPNVIYPGQRLYIAAAANTGWVKPGCEHLTWPRDGARLSGVVQARGTADLASFGYYKLEYRKDGLDEWHYVTGAETPVRNGALGAWDTRTVGDGRYVFRLVVVDRTGNYPSPCEIVVHVDN